MTQRHGRPATKHLESTRLEFVIEFGQAGQLFVHPFFACRAGFDVELPAGVSEAMIDKEVDRLLDLAHAAVDNAHRIRDVKSICYCHSELKYIALTRNLKVVRERRGPHV